MKNLLVARYDDEEESTGGCNITWREELVRYPITARRGWPSRSRGKLLAVDSIFSNPVKRLNHVGSDLDDPNRVQREYKVLSDAQLDTRAALNAHVGVGRGRGNMGEDLPLPLRYYRRTAWHPFVFYMYSCFSSVRHTSRPSVPARNQVATPSAKTLRHASNHRCNIFMRRLNY